MRNVNAEWYYGWDQEPVEETHEHEDAHENGYCYICGEELI